MPCPHKLIVVAVPELEIEAETLKPALRWRQVVSSHSMLVELYGLSPWTGRLEYTVLGDAPR